MARDLAREADEARGDARAILAVVAAGAWAAAHDGAECPDNRIPTVADLGTVSFSLDAVKAAVAASSAAFGIEGWQLMTGGDVAASEARGMDFGFALYFVWHPVRTARPDLARPPSVDGSAHLEAIEDVHAAWLAAGRPRPHPLTPLVSAWQQWKATHPVPHPAVDTDAFPNVILPRSAAVVDEHAPSYYLSRFNRAAHRDPYGQLQLGFEHPEMDGPTLPANVWTLQLAEAEKRGRGLATALRAFIAAIVHVPLHARPVTSPDDPPVMLRTPRDKPLTLRHFLPMVYSGRARPGEYWHVLHGVRSVLHSEAADVPYEWNGRIWTRSVVRMDGIPEGAYETAMLDEPWPVAVWLPPGDGTGAPIRWELLLRLMCTDPAAARLLINLAYRWHVEGKRLHPAPGGRHWLYRRDPKFYDRFTDREADLYCFPPGTGHNRRDRRIADGWGAAERLIKLGGAVPVDGRLLPSQTSDG